MSDRKLTAKLAALAALTLIVSACSTTLPEGAAKARIDALQIYVGPCAGSLAGEDMETARKDCTPLLLILDGA